MEVSAVMEEDHMSRKRPKHRPTTNNAGIGTLSARITLLLHLTKAGLLPRFLGEPTKSFTLEQLDAIEKDGQPNLKADLLDAAEKAGLLCRRENTFSASSDLLVLSGEAPFLAWGLFGCSPYLDKFEEFITAPEAARKAYKRDGKWVALSSSWIGDSTFYCPVTNAVLRLKPEVILDIGAGNARFLAMLIEKIPHSRGVAVDMDPDACKEARKVVASRGLNDRIQILQRRAESLMNETPKEIIGANVIIMLFVCHEVLKQGNDFLSHLLNHISSSVLSPSGRFLIVEAVTEEDPTPFGALFRYVHRFQGQRIPTNSEWISIFSNANLRLVSIVSAIMPGSILYELERER